MEEGSVTLGSVRDAPERLIAIVIPFGCLKFLMWSS